MLEANLYIRRMKINPSVLLAHRKTWKGSWSLPTYMSWLQCGWRLGGKFVNGDGGDKIISGESLASLLRGDGKLLISDISANSFTFNGITNIYINKICLRKIVQKMPFYKLQFYAN